MFDIEIAVPLCNKMRHRINDFRRYGLVNRGSRSVLLSIILSGESIQDVEKGWPEGVEVRLIENESPNHIANLYRFYTEIDPSSPRSRWLARIDDDSCTDIDGLVTNLDRFFGSEKPFYLGNLNPFGDALNMGESDPYFHYKELLGPFESIAHVMRNEVECGIMSSAAITQVLNNEPSMNLLRRRSELEGGFGDCLVAIASAMAGVWPVECPFVTRHPLVHDFSLLGGLKNHIHLISRTQKWSSTSPECFILLTKVIDYNPTDMERAVEGNRFLLEDEDSLRSIHFSKGYVATMKPERQTLNWCEIEGEITLFVDGNISDRFQIDSKGNLKSEQFTITKI
jgi:hypothetical protein